MTAREKLARIRGELEDLFFERSQVIDGALTALLSRQHLLVIGPPGTAKSMLAEELCRRVEGAEYFQWLLTRFSTPEELFGAVSLRALERDDYRRVTARKLPEAHIAFLDEIFKANSSILNAILALMNERIFHNGCERVPVPLLTLIGASNELPEEDELQALYDRFLIRFVVDYIAEDFRFIKMLQGRPRARVTTLSLAELTVMQEEAVLVEVPGAAVRIICDIRRELGRKNIVASDRRYRQAVEALKAHAFLHGRGEVAEDDLGFLANILWKEPSERGEVATTIRQLLHGHEDEVRELLYQSRELAEYALRAWGSEQLARRARVEAHAKMRRILEKLDEIAAGARGLGRPLGEVMAIRKEIEALQEKVAGGVRETTGG